LNVLFADLSMPCSFGKGIGIIDCHGCKMRKVRHCLFAG
jgi:hypothetical protein